MGYHDLFIGQTIQLTCLYLLALQILALLTVQAIPHPESNPAGPSDIAEYAGQAPADGIPIQMGVSSSINSEHKPKITQVQSKVVREISPRESSKYNRRQNSGGKTQSNKGGLGLSSSLDPATNDQKTLEQKLKLLQLIDQLGFDEAIRSFQEQARPEFESNFESSQTPSPTSNQPIKSWNKNSKTQNSKTEPPPPSSQVNENEQKAVQFESANVEKYSGLNGTLEQSVSMGVSRNQNSNPKSLSSPPHHQTNVYIQQTKFHNNHQDIFDKSNTQNEQVVVGNPVLATEYLDDVKDDDYDNENDKGELIYDEDRRNPTEEQLREVMSRISVTTQKPKDKTTKTTTKRTTTTKKIKTTKKATTRPTSKPTKQPYDLLSIDDLEVGTERIEPVLPCPTFLEFVVEAQVFWNSLKETMGTVNTYELVVKAIVHSMKKLGRCFYRVSSDMIQVIMDFFGVREQVNKSLAEVNKRDIMHVKSSHR